MLPFRFGGLAENLTHHLGELEKLAEDEREKAEQINRLRQDGAFDLALDPTRMLTAPAEATPVPHFNFAPLKNAVGRVNESAERLDSALAGLDGSEPLDFMALNERLYLSERVLTSEDGLPGRDWYRHQIYAPGFYTGYGVKTLPRVRESIEAELYDEVDGEIAFTAAVLDGFADYLDGMRALIEANEGE